MNGEARSVPPGRGPSRADAPSATIGGAGLRTRTAALAALEIAYGAGTNAMAAGLLIAGGFVPVLGRWLDDRLQGWSDVVRVLGGLPPAPEPRDPDADLGPVLGRSDAPPLFEQIDELARRAGVRPPGQVRLSYLPCCGVVAWGRRRRRTRALLIGLPLLHVLSAGELRAVLAHELAHLAHGDPTSAERSERFVGMLGRSLDDPSRRGFGPLRAWARVCHAGGERWLAPLARAREERADRFAAAAAGGHYAASSLVKVALVQALFREVVDRYDPDRGEGDARNLYSFFRTFWDRLPADVLAALRHGLMHQHEAADAVHPPLVERLAKVQAFDARTGGASGPAAAVLGDLEAMEQLLHNRLFDAVPSFGSTVFHRAGS